MSFSHDIYILAFHQAGTAGGIGEWDKTRAIAKRKFLPEVANFLALKFIN